MAEPGHFPVERERGRVIDCSCGDYRQEGVYNTPFGAQVAYLDHLVWATAWDNGWSPSEKNPTFWVGVADA